ncbi:MAG: T9SS type A sorting domain-containing protein, partial [Saprospiraceae bacterium]
SHGTYRLYIEVPQTVLSETCPVHGTPGPIEVYNTAFQLIGYVGNWYGDASGTYYSNQVFVGHTVDTDISYTFVDVPETGAELAYDDGENVTINTSACKNSDLWWLAIFEDGPTYHRYWALGWFNGPVSSLDLSFLWDDMVGNNFEPYHSYTVQFAVENKSCINSSWNNLDRTFFICPSGTGCRLGEDPDQISIYPNPAYSTINLNNFTPDLGRIYQVYIFDFLGRAIKQVQLTSNEVDVSDLANGIYSLVVQENKKQIFVSKLIISH